MARNHRHSFAELLRHALHLSSIALLIVAIIWNRSRIWFAWLAFSAITFRYGFHMSLHTYFSTSDLSAPNQSKNDCSVDSFLASPSHSNRLWKSSIWYTNVRYLRPLWHCTSSTPIAFTSETFRCFSPQLTAISTEQNTWCQLVWNAFATSCQLIRLAHLDRYHP